MDEYKTLREEMAALRQINSNIYLANITVTALLIGYSIKDNQSWYMFLSPFFIVIPSIVLISTNMGMMIRISSYIQVFIESNDENLNWHNRLYKLRSLNFVGSKRTSFTNSIILLFSLLSAFCILLSIFYALKKNEDINLVFTVILVSLLLLFVTFRKLRNESSRARFQNYVNAWEKIKSDPK